MFAIAKWLMLIAFGVAALMSVWPGSPAWATIQDESCWAPDIEYPVPCDDDEE